MFKLSSYLVLVLLIASATCLRLKGRSDLALTSKVARIDNEADLRNAQATVLGSNSKSGWILLSYVGPSTLHFSASGSGGASELKNYLQDDQIQYAVLRAGGKDTFITWVGPQVGIIEKGKKSANLGDAQSFLQPFHSQITATSRNSF